MANILIVEDDPMVAESLGEVIGDLGHQVTTTGMLADAVEMAGEAQIDLALLDINVVGGETTPVAKALDARGIQFVVMSGDAARPSGYGTAPVLQKPFRTSSLVLLLNELLKSPGRASG